MSLFPYVFVLSLAFSTCQSALFCKVDCDKGRLSTPGTACDDLPLNNCAFDTSWVDPVYDKVVLLRLHNSYRSFVAQGMFGPLASSSNMKELVWDDDLEEFARSWASQCKREKKDLCGEKAFHNGMALGIDDGNSSMLPSLNYFKVPHIKMWFNEGENVFYEDLQSYHFNEKTARFTQLIWADTEKVGCTMVTYEVKDDSRESLVCMYAPPGNQEGKPIYKEGAITSKCPKGYHASTSMEGLCSNAKVNGVWGLRPGTAVLGVVLLTLKISF